MSKEVDIERRALELAAEALELPEAERQSFLSRQSGNDERIRSRAQSILAARPKDDFLPTGGPPGRVGKVEIPDRIGSYLIEDIIDAGGMGIVYRGRSTNPQFDHVVAIKIVPRERTSDRLTERLRVERRTLARLKHAHIAQFYDGGETSDGSPYIVMEFVPGLPLGAYLASRDVSLQERLRIFQEVCEAVAYAHRNLIIHRDISPANIIVNDDGRAKLIDFGISHDISDQGDLGAALPRHTNTARYAAPERVEAALASTVTDIYSLGVILSELTAGISAPRRRDLDAIAAKASASALEARYQTAEALSADLRAYSEGRPVEAVKGGTIYALSRAIGRRPVASLGGGLALAAIIGASVVSSLFYLRADRAETEAVKRFDEVRGIASFMMFDLADDVSQLDNSLQARRNLYTRSLAYLDALALTSDPSPQLTIELALGYARLSDIAGNPATLNLGDRDQAEALLTKAETILGQLPAQEAGLAPALRARFQIDGKQAGLLAFGAGEQDAALLLFRKAISLGEQLMRGDGFAPADRKLLAQLKVQNGQILGGRGRFAEARASINSGIELLELLSAEPSRASEEWNGLLGWATVSLGEAISREATATETYDYADAALAFDRGVDLLRKANAAPAPYPLNRLHLVTGLLKRANTICDIPDRVSGGVEDLREAKLLAQAMQRDEPGNDSLRERLGHITTQQVYCFHVGGRVDEAVSMGEEAVETRLAYLQLYPENMAALRDTLNALTVVVDLRRQIGDVTASCSHARRGIEIFERLNAELQTQLAGERDWLEDIIGSCPAARN
jgi:serine/threonine protein kinase